MADSNPSVRELLWTGLNPLGRAATVLMFVGILWILLSYMFPWQPLRLVRDSVPLVAHYIATVLLLMIDVPLAWAAWKAQKSDLARRWLAVSYLAVAFIPMLEARFALEKDERWRPRTEIVVLVTLIFIQLGIGRRNRPLQTPVSESLRE